MHRLDGREIDRGDVAEKNRRHRSEPGKARADHCDIHAIACGAEEIPAEAEGVGGERNDVLPLDQQEREIMREVIADRDRHQAQGEAACDGKRGEPLLRDGAHDRADPDISAAEYEPEGNEPRRSDRHEPQIAQG